MSWKVSTEASRASRRKYYHANREAEMARIASRKQKLQDWFKELKRTLRCQRCGFSHPAALQFHHRDPGTKSFDLSRSVVKIGSKTRILEEIAKCEVLCANCHAIQHSTY